MLVYLYRAEEYTEGGLRVCNKMTDSVESSHHRRVLVCARMR